MYGERLKGLRKERNMTIEDLSTALGFPRSTYAGYETEKRKPSIETIIRLAEFYNVSTDYILGLSDDRDPKKVENNIKEYLKKEGLNWDGRPLSDEELKPIKEILEIVVRDRLPNIKK